MNAILEQLGINLQVVFVQMVAFLVLFAILYKFLFKRVAGFMKTRTEEIESTFKKIEQERAEIDRLAKEYKDHLANIEKEAYAKIQEAIKEGTSARNEIVTAAQENARSELEKARSEIHREKEKAILELRNDVIKLSLQATEKIIEMKMDETIHGKLVDGFLRDIEKAKR